MAKFTDREGDDWLVVLDLGMLKRIRSTLEVDLLNLDESLVTKLSTDPFILVDVLWLVCEEQANKRDVDDVAFGRRLSDGDVIQSASTALLEAIADFFPSHRRGPMRKVLAKLSEVQDREAKLIAEVMSDDRIDLMMTTMLDKAETEARVEIDRMLEGLTSGKQSTDSLESSESPVSAA